VKKKKGWKPRLERSGACQEGCLGEKKTERREENFFPEGVEDYLLSRGKDSNANKSAKKGSPVKRKEGYQKKPNFFYDRVLRAAGAAGEGRNAPGKKTNSPGER